MTALLALFSMAHSGSISELNPQTPGPSISAQRQMEMDREEQIRVVKSLAALPKAAVIEVFLLPSKDPHMTGPRATTIRRVFKRGDPQITPLLTALVASQRAFPHSAYRYLLCGFHADTLIRPSSGEQVALCFGCGIGLTTSLSNPDADSIRKANELGGWDLGDAKKIAAELTKLFPGETFPR